MNERERFEQYMRDRYGDISLDIDDVYEWYAEIAVRFAWAAWQARADLAAEREKRLVEAARKAQLALVWGSISDEEAICALDTALIATHESKNARSGGQEN